jgi:uncharacterized protein (DUF433 family)
VAAGTWLRRSCTASVALWTEWRHILIPALIACGSATSHTSSALSAIACVGRTNASVDPFERDGVLSGMNYMERITIEPGKRSGKPCIRGLRITVSDILDYLASGMTEDEILSDFPDLEREDIRAALAFAADRERRLMSVPPA